MKDEVETVYINGTEYTYQEAAELLRQDARPQPKSVLPGLIVAVAIAAVVLWLALVLVTGG